MRYVLLAAAAMVFEARPAEACTCAPLQGMSFPQNGAVEVPLDPLFVVSVASESQRVELTSDAGNLIVLDLERIASDDRLGTLLVGRSPVELQPNTGYISNSGSSFTTGIARDDTPPSAAGLTAIEAEVMPWSAKVCGDSCTPTVDGRLSRFRISYERPADVVFAILELHQQFDPRLFRVAISGDTVLGDNFCGFATPAIDSAATYCGRVIVYDAGGNMAVGDEVCSTPVTTCATERDPQSTCDPSNECNPPSGGCSTSGGNTGWLVFAMFAISRGSSRRSARRRRSRATRPAP